MSGSSGWKCVTQMMPRKATSMLCARGFLLPTRTRLSLRVVRMTHVLPGTRFLEETGVEAEPDSRSLIYLEKQLLKALCAVNTDSAVWRCQNCSFLLTSFPKCSYCILQNHASDLQFLMPVLFRPQDGDFPVPLGFPTWSYGCGFLSAPSFPLSVLLSPYTLQQHLAEHQSIGGRLPRVTLGSPIFAPFLLHHNPFSLSKL